MQVHLRLPGEAHPAEYLQTVTGVAAGRLVGEHLRGGGLAAVAGHRSRVYRGTRPLDAQQHVRAQMLDGLEGPDGPSELLSRPGVLYG